MSALDGKSIIPDPIDVLADGVKKAEKYVSLYESTNQPNYLLRGAIFKAIVIFCSLSLGIVGIVMGCIPLALLGFAGGLGALMIISLLDDLTNIGRHII